MPGDQSANFSANETDEHLSWFARFASGAGRFTAHPGAFLFALTIIFVWAISGSYFNYNTTWQLAINTSTTIITFLMVFLIQHTQKRDTLALQLKLSELIFVIEGAEKRVAIAEHLPDEEIQRLRKDHRERAAEHAAFDSKPTPED